MPKMKLTAAAVERIKPSPDGRTEYFDSLTPGFALRVSPKGAKSWIKFYRIGGKLRRLTIGRYPALSLADARKEAGKTVDQVDQGIDPAQEKKIRKRELLENPRTFEEVADLFIERYAKKEKRSWKNDELHLKKIICPLWGHRPIETIKKSDVVAMLDHVEDERGVYAANRTLASVRKMMNWAMVERALLEANPIGPGMARKGEKARDRVLTDDELKNLWEAATEIGWPFGNYFKVLILTGQRRNEVSELLWQELDLNAREWTLPVERAKNRLETIIPLSDMALDVFKNTQRLNEFVFSTGQVARRKDVDKTKARPISGFSKFKIKLEKKSGVTGWVFQDLRRTVRTNLSKIGIPPHVAERVLAHKQQGIGPVYDKFEYLDEKREALSAWARHIGLSLDPDTREAVSAYLGADVEEGQRTRRRRKYNESIREGGARWDAFLTRAKDPGGKVVNING